MYYEIDIARIVFNLLSYLFIFLILVITLSFLLHVHPFDRPTSPVKIIKNSNLESPFPYQNSRNFLLHSRFGVRSNETKFSTTFFLFPDKFVPITLACIISSAVIYS